MAAENDVTAARPVDEVMMVDMDQLLEEHRRRQMLEHLTGPMISVLLHMVVLTIAFFFLVSPEQIEVPEFEVTIKEVKVKQLEQKVVEQKAVIENKIDAQVPVVDKPVISADGADGDGGDGGDGGTGGGATGDFSDGPASNDTGVDAFSVLEMRADRTPLRMSALYGGRTNAGRKGSGGRRGGQGPTMVTESAVLKALRWLKAHQNPDGSWSQSRPVAMSGLALLAFLGHGELPDSAEFGGTVQKALQYLSDKMINSSGIQEQEYSHGIATYALGEGYGMTKIPSLKPAMEKGLRTIIDGQQFTGGWDYGFKKGERWDLSVSGWQIQALKAGFIAGADLPDLVPAIEKSISWLKKENFASGTFRYSNGGGGNGANMQGIGALCLALLGEGNAPEAKAAVNWINQNVTVVYDKDTAYLTPYGWYYQTQAVFHEAQNWKKWNEQFTKELVRAQKPDGHWEATGGGEYDPFMQTSFCCLMLEVYYRFLPTFKMDLHSKPVAAGPTLDVGETKGLELKTE